MTLQNRVNPFSDILATPARGALMGNRGILHDGNRKLTKRWAHQQWIHCVLGFKGRRRVPMSQGNYTELFFLDEATALAAGHRPCGECQREKYRAFKALFEQCHERSLSSKEIDKILHGERLTWQAGKRTKQKRLVDVALGDLPNGAFVAVGDEAFLWHEQRLLRWSFEGYERVVSAETTQIVQLITPISIVAVLRLGYEPAVHPSATAV